MHHQDTKTWKNRKRKMVLTGFLLCAITAWANESYQPDLEAVSLKGSISNQRITSAGQFGGPLLPSHQDLHADDPKSGNHEFARIMNLWNQHEYVQAKDDFDDFIKNYAGSPWVIEALLHVGCEALYMGRYCDAENQFYRIMDRTEKLTSYEGKVLHGKALARLSNLAIARGDLQTASDFLVELSRNAVRWRDSQYASHWIKRISRMKKDPAKLNTCGIDALKAYFLAKQFHPKYTADLFRSQEGSSIKDLLDIAEQAQFPMQAFQINWQDLPLLPLPVIIHIPPHSGGTGHYWIIEKLEHNTAYLFDPHSGRRFQQSYEKLGTLWEGVVLMEDVPSETYPGVALEPYKTLELKGGCCGIRKPEGDLGDPCEPCPSFKGEPQWRINPINLNLFVGDIPLWYEPAYGPAIEFQFSYSSQGSTNFYEPCGPKWQFNYASYLVVDPGDTITVFMPDGARHVYNPNGSGGYIGQNGVSNTLTKLAENHFELETLERATIEYAIPTGTSSQQPLLIGISDRNGNTVEVHYHSNMNISQVVAADGKTFTFTYDGSNQITRIDDPFGRHASLSYSAGNLHSITDMGGFTHYFTYDGDIMMTSMGNITNQWSFQYELADGIDNGKLEYPEPGVDDFWESERITVTNPSGEKAEYYYCGLNKFSWYVPFGNYIPYVSPTQNNLNATREFFDLGTDIDGKDVVTERTRLDESTVISGLGAIYDPATNNSIVGWRIWDSYDFSIGGRFYELNEKKQITSFGTMESYDKLTFIDYAPNNMDPISISDERGTIQLQWTSNSNLTRIVDRNGDTTDMTYDSVGRILSINDPEGRVSQVAYVQDGPDRLVTLTRNGETLEEISYNNRGLVQSQLDASGKLTTFTYNNLNDVTQITLPEGGTTQIGYSSTWPHQMASVDEMGETTLFTLDEQGRRQSATLASGQVVSTIWGANNQIQQIQRPDGATTTFQYDSAGRQISKTWPDGQTRTIHWYEGDTRLHFRVNTAKGQEVMYSMWRPMEMDGPGAWRVWMTGTCDETGCFPDIAAGEDPINHLDPPRQLESAIHTHDQYNRIIEIQQMAYDPLSDTMVQRDYTYDYDELDRTSTSFDPWTGAIMDFEYNGLNSLTRLQITPDSGPVETTTYQFDDFDRVTGITKGTRHYLLTYATASRMPVTLVRPGNLTTQFNYDTHGNTVGRITQNSLHETVSSILYTYDSKFDITSRQVSGHSDFTLDGMNLLTTFNLSDQPVSDSNSDTFTHDSDGNLTTWRNADGYWVNAVYDPHSRLSQAQFTDGQGDQVEYRFNYGADEKLVSHQRFLNGSLENETRILARKDIPVMTFNLTRDSSGNELDFTLNNSFTFSDWDYHGLGRLLEVNNNSGTFFPIMDLHGNVLAELDTSGTIVTDRQLSPYGQEIGQQGESHVPLVQNTRPYFEELGIVYVGARFSLPAMQRWLSRDPLEERVDLNLYRDRAGNPIRYLDTDGEAFIGAGLVIIGGIALYYTLKSAIEKGQNNHGNRSKRMIGNSINLCIKQSNINKYKESEKELIKDMGETISKCTDNTSLAPNKASQFKALYHYYGIR